MSEEEEELRNALLMRLGQAITLLADGDYYFAKTEIRIAWGMMDKLVEIKEGEKEG